MTDIAWLAFLVAAIGASARYLIDGLVQDHTDGAFPLGTFVVNVSGCLVLGTISELGLYHGFDATTRTVLGTGGTGAYSGRAACGRERAWRSPRLRSMGERRDGRGTGTSCRKMYVFGKGDRDSSMVTSSGSPVLIRPREHHPTVVYRVEVLILPTTHTPGSRASARGNRRENVLTFVDRVLGRTVAPSVPAATSASGG